MILLYATRKISLFDVIFFIAFCKFTFFFWFLESRLGSQRNVQIARHIRLYYVRMNETVIQ